MEITKVPTDDMVGDRITFKLDCGRTITITVGDITTSGAHPELGDEEDFVSIGIRDDDMHCVMGQDIDTNATWIVSSDGVSVFTLNDAHKLAAKKFKQVNHGTLGIYYRVYKLVPWHEAAVPT